MAMIVAFLALNSGERAIAEPVVVAALGDSLVQGYGLGQGQGFVPQMQAALDGLGFDVTLVNAGVSGDTTAGGLMRVDWTLTSDVQALIVSLGGNDILRGVAPSFAKENLTKILQTATAQNLPVMLIGISAPSNFGADYKMEFDAIYPNLAEKFGAVFYPNFLAALSALNDRNTTMNTLMQRDGLHPNAQGMALIVADMAPVIGDLLDRIADHQ